MSYSLNKNKINNVPGFDFSGVDLGFLEVPTRQVTRDSAVEELVDDIRDNPCMFRFKKPLGRYFDKAADHAQNCLELPQNLPPRKVRHWFLECFGCLDCLCVVLWKDILGKELPAAPTDCVYYRERVFYQEIRDLNDLDLKAIGSSLNNAYKIRNDVEHPFFIQKKKDRVDLKRWTTSKWYDVHDESRRYFHDALDKLVQRYRDKYPEERTDSSTE